MLSIKEVICDTLNDALSYYEPIFKRAVRKIINDESKEDCKQELRLKVWDLYERKDRVFNESYVGNRLKWDVINFMNRNIHIKFGRRHVLVEDFSDISCDSSQFVCYNTIEEDLISEERRKFLSDFITKCKPKMRKRQYEALVLFLSCENNKILRRFYGTGKKNLTQYYINLASALEILKSEAKKQKIKEIS